MLAFLVMRTTHHLWLPPRISMTPRAAPYSRFRMPERLLMPLKLPALQRHGVLRSLCPHWAPRPWNLLLLWNCSLSVTHCAPAIETSPALLLSPLRRRPPNAAHGRSLCRWLHRIWCPIRLLLRALLRLRMIRILTIPYLPAHPQMAFLWLTRLIPRHHWILISRCFSLLLPKRKTAAEANSNPALAGASTITTVINQ